MEVEIITRKENNLLNRTELKFKATHKNKKTPERKAVRAKLASLVNVPKENIIIAWMCSSFGSQETLGYAKLYSSAEDALKSEHKYLLARNKLVEEKIVKPKAKVKEASKGEGK